jgi:Flp pilus assembly protein TadB
MRAMLVGIIDGINPSAVGIFAGILLALVLTLFGLGVFEGQNQQLQRRIERIRQPRSAGNKGDEPQQMESLRRNRSDSKFSGIDKVLKRILPDITMMRSRLERSGWQLKIGDYLLVCAVIWLAIVLLLWMVLGLSMLVSVLVGFLAGLGLPHIALQWRIGKHTKKFAMLCRTRLT